MDRTYRSSGSGRPFGLYNSTCVCACRMGERRARGLSEEAMLSTRDEIAAAVIRSTERERERVLRGL